jgi:hypothetical protein
LRGTFTPTQRFNVGSSTTGKTYNIILENGCNVTLNSGIYQTKNGMYRINIYAQTPGYVPNIPGNAATTGKLTSNGTIVAHTKVDGSNTYVAELEIHGGEIIANGTGGDGLFAGIGGGGQAPGSGEAGGKVTIYGGKITATGGSGTDGTHGSAGIGGSCGYPGGEVIIYGGVVEAKGGNGGTDGGPGIGGYDDSDIFRLRGNAVVAAKGRCPGPYPAHPDLLLPFNGGTLDAIGGHLFLEDVAGTNYGNGILFDDVTLESDIIISPMTYDIHMAGNGVGGKTLNLAGHTITWPNSQLNLHQGGIEYPGAFGYGTLKKPGGASGFNPNIHPTPGLVILTL